MSRQVSPPRDKVCRVLGCSRLRLAAPYPSGYRVSSMCTAHLQRQTRHGSPTARYCSIGRHVVDDEHDETHLIGKTGKWRCLRHLDLPTRKKSR